MRGQNSATQATHIVNMENVKGQNSATQASKKLGVLHQSTIMVTSGRLGQGILT